MTTDEFCFEALKRQKWVAVLDKGYVYSAQAHRRVGGANTKGYQVATLHLDGARKQVKIHRIIWIAANGIPPVGMMIDHINGDKSDNRIENLRLADPILNSMNRRSYRREGNPAAKLNMNIANAIRGQYKSGGKSYKKLAKVFEVSPSLIAQVIRNELWF